MQRNGTCTRMPQPKAVYQATSVRPLFFGASRRQSLHCTFRVGMKVDMFNKWAKGMGEVAGWNPKDGCVVFNPKQPLPLIPAKNMELRKYALLELCISNPNCRCCPRGLALGDKGCDPLYALVPAKAARYVKIAKEANQFQFVSTFFFFFLAPNYRRKDPFNMSWNR